MSRKSRQIRIEHEERWPWLYQFLAAYLHQDWPVLYRNPWAAVEQAISEYDLSGLKAVATDWWDWNASRSSWGDLQSSINDGLGVNVRFDSEADARAFMNEVYDRLVIQVRQTEKYWRPGKG